MNSQNDNVATDPATDAPNPQGSKLGSGPSPDIPNGGTTEEKSPKENTGGTSHMGGAGGGTKGMGNGKQIEE